MTITLNKILYFLFVRRLPYNKELEINLIERVRLYKGIIQTWEIVGFWNKTMDVQFLIPVKDLDVFLEYTESKI